MISDSYKIRTLKLSDRKLVLDYLRRQLLTDLMYFGPEEKVILMYINNLLVDYSFREVDGEYFVFIDEEDYTEEPIKKALLIVSMELYNIPFNSLILWINRMCHDISPEDAGKLCGVSRQAYAKWESGEKVPVRIETLKKIAKGMNFDLEEFTKEYWKL